MDNIKIDLRERVWDGVDWINLAQDRDRWRALVDIGNELSCSIKCWEVLSGFKIGSFSRRVQLHK
jgi:hypothetical protein